MVDTLETAYARLEGLFYLEIGGLLPILGFVN